MENFDKIHSDCVKNQGETVTPYSLEKKLYPLVHAAQVANPEVPKNLTE